MSCSLQRQRQRLIDNGPHRQRGASGAVCCPRGHHVTGPTVTAKEHNVTYTYTYTLCFFFFSMFKFTGRFAYRSAGLFLSRTFFVAYLDRRVRRWAPRAPFSSSGLDIVFVNADEFQVEFESCIRRDSLPFPCLPCRIPFQTWMRGCIRTGPGWAGLHTYTYRSRGRRVC